MTKQTFHLKTTWQFSIATLLFYATGWLAMRAALPPHHITDIWPPAGIGLAAVLLWGYSVLPYLFIATLALASHLFDLSNLFNSTHNILIVLSIALSGILRIWLGSILIRRFLLPPYILVGLRQIALFFLLAGPAAAFVPTYLTILALHFSGTIASSDIYYFFVKAWLADSTGIVIFIPLFFIIFDREQPIWQARILSLGLPLALCFLIASALNLFFQHQKIKQLHRVMAQHSRVIQLDLQNNLSQYQAILQTYKDLILINPSISKENFHQLSHASFRQQADILRLEWLQTDTNNAPVHYVATKENAQTVQSKTLPDWFTKLNTSSRSVVVFHPDTLLIYLPISQSSRVTSGIVGVFSLNNIISKLIKHKQQQHVIVNLYNTPDQPIRRGILQAIDTPQVVDPLNLSTLSKLFFADHVWLLKIFPDDNFLKHYFPLTIWQLLSEGTLLPGILATVLLMLTGRNEAINLQVVERTEVLKKSNRKLVSRDKQFQKLVKTQSVIVWRADPVSFRFVYVNNEAEIILGYPITQWKTEPDFWRKHIHPDDIDRVQAFFAEEKSPRDDNFEYRMIEANGNIVWLRDIFTKVVNKGGVKELYGLMIDITRQKLAEEEFRVAAITFESQQGIMITDKNSKILRVNNAFTEITGFSAKEAIGNTPKMLQSGRHESAFYKNLWHQLSTKGKFEGEIWNRRKSGEIYPEWQTITAVENKGEITHYVSVFSDITQKKEAEDKIHHLAFYDALTGLPNRRLLLDRFEQEIAIARRHKQFGAVIFLDLDHFKLLNDSQGHLVGDELLIQVANRLSSVLREEDTPARLGGDEFVILLHANSENLTLVSEHARTVAEKIRKQLNTPFLLNQYQHQISTSIGITLFPEGSESPDMILQQADTAMYRSKATGRNAISFFQPSMQEAADQRLKLEQDLRSAIDKEDFLLFFQPQVDRNGTMLGAEVLIRWEHPDQGIVSPGDFIAVAEESSLILDIGLWVLNRTCQQIKTWQDAGIKVPRLSINVSSRQFRQQDFIEQIKNALLHSQISPQTLSIELTESVMIVDMDDTIAKMKALKKLGVSIAVDDFGTGYSSLAYLKRLPLDVLKIDRGFVRDILTDSNDAVIVETIISMASHLKLRVIAEGVESAEQFEALKKHGCLMFQGYHFSRPLTAAHFAKTYLQALEQSDSLQALY